MMRKFHSPQVVVPRNVIRSDHWKKLTGIRPGSKWPDSGDSKCTSHHSDTISHSYESTKLFQHYKHITNQVFIESASICREIYLRWKIGTCVTKKTLSITIFCTRDVARVGEWKKDIHPYATAARGALTAPVALAPRLAPPPRRLFHSPPAAMLLLLTSPSRNPDLSPLLGWSAAFLPTICFPPTPPSHLSLVQCRSLSLTLSLAFSFSSRWSLSFHFYHAFSPILLSIFVRGFPQVCCSNFQVARFCLVFQLFFYVTLLLVLFSHSPTSRNKI